MLDDNYSVFLRTYNTILRNIGLYISLSLATLAYSRFFRKQSKSNIFNVYNIVIIIISITLLSVSFMINYNLINDMNDITASDELNISDVWLKIPYFTMCTIIILFILAIYTLYRQF